MLARDRVVVEPLRAAGRRAAEEQRLVGGGSSSSAVPQQRDGGTPLGSAAQPIYTVAPSSAVATGVSCGGCVAVLAPVRFSVRDVAARRSRPHLEELPFLEDSAADAAVHARRVRCRRPPSGRLPPRATARSSSTCRTWSEASAAQRQLLVQLLAALARCQARGSPSSFAAASVGAARKPSASSSAASSGGPACASPWVDIELQGLKNDGGLGRPALMIIAFDTLLFAAFVPVFTLGRFRTLANPLLGLPHAPHRHPSTSAAPRRPSFSTEPEMKASMMASTTTSASGGWVCMVRRRRRRRRRKRRRHHPPAPRPAQRRPARAAQFPEGRVHLGHGSANTSVLQPFRVGGMGRSSTTWSLGATVGNNDCWPRNGVGGPARSPRPPLPDRARRLRHVRPPPPGGGPAGGGGRLGLRSRCRASPPTRSSRCKKDRCALRASPVTVWAPSSLWCDTVSLHGGDYRWNRTFAARTRRRTRWRRRRDAQLSQYLERARDVARGGGASRRTAVKCEL